MPPPSGSSDPPRRPSLLERLRGPRAAAPPPAPAPAPNGAPAPRDSACFGRAAAPGRFAVERGDASARLLARVEAATRAALEERIAADPRLAPIWSGASDPVVRRHLLLAFGAHLHDAELLAQTGLSDAQPPPEVHSMASGPLAAAGGIYEADMVCDALASAGVDVAAVRAGLDFGCSSGRVARVLAAAFPDARWSGCDPNHDAVRWAAEAFPAVRWFASANEPPLPLADGELDLVYAISIWSHFEPGLGLRWFEEMRRLLEPGGHLVVTTHGWTALAYDARLARRPEHELAEIERALTRDGHWFIDPFGEAGDWGVVNPRWGSAFVTADFLAEQLCPSWRVVEFVPGRNQDNQDVYVLARA
jgi:SAM-dependent methyltransferase